MKTKKQTQENPLNLFKFIPIPAGKFTMGSPESEEGRWEDENQVEVEITKPFEMGETQVTQLQYYSIMDVNPSTYEGMQKPVHNVSWNGAQKFIEKLNELDEFYEYRLPTEAEWEYACRAGTTEAYSCPEINQLEALPGHAHFNYSDGPINVKSKNFNGFHLYDMHGNVWEWTNSWYENELKGGKDPKGPKIGSYRVMRGGSWYNVAQFVRSAHRYFDHPGFRYDYVGFRLVRDKICTQKTAQEKYQNEHIQNLNPVKNADQKNLSIDITKIIKNLLKSYFYVENVTFKDIKIGVTGDMDQENTSRVSSVQNNSFPNQITVTLKLVDQNALVRLAEELPEKDGADALTLLPSSETRDSAVELILKNLDQIRKQIEELYPCNIQFYKEKE
jgi:hypothetical protein